MTVVNEESTLVVFDGFERQQLEVMFQDEVVLDIEVPLFYIKSGEEEIKHYVNTVAKPDINLFTDGKKAELDAVSADEQKEIEEYSAGRQQIIENSLDNYAAGIRTELDNYV